MSESLAAGEEEEPIEEPVEEPIDLYTLVAQFTALRQEINLQTRSVRQQQELNVETLRQYEQALALAKPLPLDENASARPMLTALIEAADVQTLAARELDRVVQGITGALDELALRQPRPHPALPRPRGFIGRWLGLGVVAENQQRLIDELEQRVHPSPKIADAFEQIRTRLNAAASGLALGLQRLERIMQQNGLTPIASVGQPFDPSLMEAIEAVGGEGTPAGHVIDELRRGYQYQGRLFRFAQVRVAK